MGEGFVWGGGHWFESGRLHKFLNQHNKHQQPINGCHVAALDWATWHPNIRSTRCHVSQYNSPTDNQSMIATSSATSTATLIGATSPYGHHVSCMASVQSTCTDCPVSIKFLPIWLNEQIAISSPYGLHLRK
jgi:hypothetical protein